VGTGFDKVSNMSGLVRNGKKILTDFNDKATS